MKHINSAEDLEPQSEGFFNRGAETINIIGNVFEDILNSFGEAISGITGQNHTRQNQTNIPFEVRNPNLPLPQSIGVLEEDAIRVERFVEHNPRDI